MTALQHESDQEERESMLPFLGGMVTVAQMPIFMTRPFVIPAAKRKAEGARGEQTHVIRGGFDIGVP